MSGALTNCVDKAAPDKAIGKIQMVQTAGRPALAPVAMGA